MQISLQQEYHHDLLWIKLLQISITRQRSGVFCGSIIAMTVEHEYPAISTFPFEMEYLPAFSIGNLPTRPLSVLISCTTGVNMFWAFQ
jgi:hypothetical protein